MIDVFQSLARRGLFLFDPEAAHGLSIKGLKTGLVPACTAPTDPRLAQTVAGLSFVNPIGLAAGYDKNAEVPEALLRLGFGFTEIGTVTPKPQAGNDKPRIFRLVEDEAVINRLGFNNEGHQAALQRLKACDRKAMIGVNIGANKDSADRIADYVTGIRTFMASPAISPPIFPRRTRPACATCRRAKACRRCFLPSLPLAMTRPPRPVSACRYS